MSTTADEMSDEQRRAQDHPPSFASLYGDLDTDVPIFQDQPPLPGPRSSASRHANKVKAGEAEAHHSLNMNQLQDKNRRRRDAEAAEEVQRRISKGLDISPALAEQAMRHEREQGGLGLSTAQQLAAGRRR